MEEENVLQEYNDIDRESKINILSEIDNDDTPLSPL